MKANPMHGTKHPTAQAKIQRLDSGVEDVGGYPRVILTALAFMLCASVAIISWMIYQSGVQSMTGIQDLINLRDGDLASTQHFGTILTLALPYDNGTNQQKSLILT